MRYRTAINVSFSVEGFHNWPSAEEFSEQVSFLKHRHRHIFYISAEKPVTHDDRDVEIILFKREMESYLRKRYLSYTEDKNAPLTNSSSLEFGQQSCEMIAKELVKAFGLDWCRVLEDNENGATVYKEDVHWSPVVFVAGMCSSGKQTFIEANFPFSKTYKVSDIVKEVLEIQKRPNTSTKDLNNSKDLSQQIADSLTNHIAHDVGDSRRTHRPLNVVIDGPRQIEIIECVGKFLNQQGITWQVVWLDVPLEEREKRFNIRQRSTDQGLILHEIDQKNIDLGIMKVEQFAQKMNIGLIIEN